MALFQMLWLRRLVRRYTNPINEYDAALWKRRLSIGYMIVAWNAFGLVMFMIYSGKADWAKSHGLVKEDPRTPAQQWCTTLGIKEATVYRVSGFNVSKYNIDETGTAPISDTSDSKELGASY